MDLRSRGYFPASWLVGGCRSVGISLQVVRFRIRWAESSDQRARYLSWRKWTKSWKGLQPVTIHWCFELLWSREAMDLCWVYAFAELNVLIIIWLSCMRLDLSTLFIRPVSSLHQPHRCRQLYILNNELSQIIKICAWRILSAVSVFGPNVQPNGQTRLAFCLPVDKTVFQLCHLSLSAKPLHK